MHHFSLNPHFHALKNGRSKEVTSSEILRHATFAHHKRLFWPIIIVKVGQYASLFWQKSFVLIRTTTIFISRSFIPRSTLFVGPKQKFQPATAYCAYLSIRWSMPKLRENIFHKKRIASSILFFASSFWDYFFSAIIRPRRNSQKSFVFLSRVIHPFARRNLTHRGVHEKKEV